MKSCNQFKDLISRYHDNDLDDFKRLSVKEHLDVCSACRSVLHSYESIGNLLHESLAVPEHLESAAIPEKKTSGNILALPIFKDALRLAAILVLGIFVVAGYRALTVKHTAIAPVVIEDESRPIMNSPLGALVYYEKLAGTTVHNQFLSITGKSTATTNTSTSQYGILSYTSPLFVDSMILAYRDDVVNTR